jgi:ribosomal protein L18
MDQNQKEKRSHTLHRTTAMEPDDVLVVVDPSSEVTVQVILASGDRSALWASTATPPEAGSFWV